MKRLLSVWLVCISLALGGCLLFPKKADLDKVHDTYRMEFANTFLINAEDENNVKKCQTGKSSETDFPKTLDAIREYEAAYRSDTSMNTELAHLTVLKAMIHLQAGNFGIAENLKDAVKNADVAVTDDREVRDSLMKQAYPYLVDGWKEVCAALEQADGSRVIRNTPDGGRPKRLNDAAEGISKIVSSVAQQDKRPGLESDDGAIYLATTANIFQYYFYRVKKDTACTFGPGDPDKCTKDFIQANPTAVQPAEDGAKLVYLLMTADEQNAARCEKNKDKGWSKVVTPGRLRYVEWYRRMNKDFGISDCPDK